MGRRNRFVIGAHWRLRALPGVLVTRDWVIAAAFSIGMASLSAAFGIVPDLAVDGWADNARLPWLVGSSVAAVVTLGTAMAMWWFRNTLLHRRGTAYLIEELSPDWDPEDRRAFKAAVRSQFSAIQEVLGPGRLRNEQVWTFDDRGCQLWDERLTDLVHSFRALHANDDPTTDNALYMWAPWSVALAFGLRTVGRHRGVHLHVRHRPSYGRLGEAQPVGFMHAGISFRDTDALRTPLTGIVTQRERSVRLCADPGGAATSVTVLLVRTSDRPYASLPAAAGCRISKMAVRDGAGLGLPRRQKVTVREWVYRPQNRFIPWREYQSVAFAAAEWIRDCSAAAEPNAIILLGTLLPQEIGVGIGIVAAAMPGWPPRLWPLMYDAKDEALVIVRLNLGRDGAPLTAPGK